MGMTIWLVGHERRCMIANQRIINERGSMQSVCLLSHLHQWQVIADIGEDALSTLSPSLIVYDYDMLLEEEFTPLFEVRENPLLAGVPVFFAVQKRTNEIDEACYEKGAVVVVHKKLFYSELLRVENAAWQFENTRQY